jgi:predicted enzyme related to lactoylglutathione lyase
MSSSWQMARRFSSPDKRFAASGVRFPTPGPLRVDLARPLNGRDGFGEEVSDPAGSVPRMDLTIANITVNTDRPKELAQWWAAALGGEITADWGEYVMIGVGSGPGLAFQYVEHTNPGRVHIDFVSADAAATVARLVDAGAARVADHEAPGGAFTWTILTDPDGNEFCVSQGN